MPLRIVRDDITKMNTDAIVNTANPLVFVGPGCDKAIYNAAGYDKLFSYRRDNIGEVAEGEAFITPGFDLKARYIIHAVSPLFIDGKSGEEELLRACYRNSLRIAAENKLKSVSFPLISSGSFGYPKEEAMRIAVDEINGFLLNNEMEIYLVVFDDNSTKLGRKLYPDLEAYIDSNYVDEALDLEYGKALRPSAPRMLAQAMPLLVEEQKTSEPEYPSAAGGSVFRKRDFLRSAQASSTNEYDEAADIEYNKAYDLELDEALDFSINSLYGASEKCYKPESAEEKSSDDFEVKHVSKLDERMEHMTDTFSEYLLYLIKEKGFENAEVYKRAIVDKKIFSKIKNNPDYHPNKLTALCLCMGAKLNLDESRDLLMRAGYALSPCDKTDIIFSYFIENRIYDMIELDIQLEEHGLPCIIE
ncbi:MAG: macro domain-containing protein [Eubacteriales bacterium]|nr:macro domain-containing protein [Eubacteriales bacterium]